MHTIPTAHTKPTAFLGIAGAALVLSLLAAGCNRQPAAPAGRHGQPLPAVPVRVQKAETRTIVSLEEVVGTIRATLRASLEARLSGRIEQMPVRLGQRVKAGDLIARLNAPEVQARLDQARAALQQAERDFARVKTLFDQQAATRSEFESMESRRSIAQANLSEADAMLAYVEVRAPFNGVITRKHADVGDLAAPGKPLVELEDPSALQMDADIPEAIAGNAQPSEKMQIKVDGLTNLIAGVVAEIAPSADPVSRTLRVKLDLPQAPGLRPGQFARLLVPTGTSASLRVPASAVVQRGQLEMAFVVANNAAVMHLVKTGRRVGDEVEIVSGLDAGDPVVIEGAAGLLDAQPVTLQ